MECIFETEHLRIRKFELDDARCLYENHLEDDVKRWIPNESYADIEETQSAIRFYMNCVNNRRLPYVLAVELRETGELIDDTGVNEVVNGYEFVRKELGAEDDPYGNGMLIYKKEC